MNRWVLRPFDKICEWRSGAYHFVEMMVDAHCVRDEGGFTLHWLVAFHSIRVRVYIISRECQPCCRRSGKVLSSGVSFVTQATLHT